jgi:hypothetical protein
VCSVWVEKHDFSTAIGVAFDDLSSHFMAMHEGFLQRVKFSKISGIKHVNLSYLSYGTSKNPVLNEFSSC